MNHKKNIVLLLAGLAGLSATAQETRPITLQDAVQLAIANSKTLNLSQARVDETQADLLAAQNRRLPDFNVTGSYVRLSSANIKLAQSKDTAARTGGSSPSSAAYGMANLSWPIFAAGRIRFGIKAAELLTEATRLDADQDKDAVAYNAAAAYFNLYKADAAIRIVQENLKASQSRDQHLGNLEKNGLLARNDLLKSQLQTSQVELSLLDAQNNRDIANSRMDILLGIPETTVLVPDSNFVFANQSLPAYPSLVQAAVQNRNDVRSIQLRRQAAGYAIRSAKAEAYPTIALTGGYIAAYVPKVITITNAVNAGIGVQFNLASLWKKNPSLLRAQSQEKQATIQSAILDDQIHLEVNKDYKDYQLATRKIAVYENAEVQAQENYRITSNKYDNSLATITDLLEANATLLSSKLDLQMARADAALAYQKLMETTGMIIKK